MSENLRKHVAELVQLALHSQGLYSARIDDVWGPLNEAGYQAYVRENYEKAPVLSLDPDWLRIARLELGTKEVPGSGNNPRIVEYHRSTDLGASPDEVPWCSSFVNWCMQESGTRGTQSAAARSWLNWGEHMPVPRPGAIAVFRRGTGWQGHVAFFLREKDGLIEVLGGNQGDAVSVAWYSKAMLLGYRWPNLKVA